MNCTKPTWRGVDQNHCPIVIVSFNLPLLRMSRWAAAQSPNPTWSSTSSAGSTRTSATSRSKSAPPPAYAHKNERLGLSEAPPRAMPKRTKMSA